MGNKQLQTGSIEHKLKNIKKQHKNLICLMGMSIVDLYPDEKWNYVFGEACLSSMVGIFSFARYFPGFFSIADCYKIKDHNERNKLKQLKAMIDGESIQDNKNL